MPYQNPTLFGVAYASRLFREVDETKQVFEELRRKTGSGLDLRNSDHAEALLVWLNKWGCMIPKKSFPVMTAKLGKWFQEWKPRLPGASIGLVSLQARHLDTLAAAYHALLTIDHFRPTCASKTLFTVCPHAAMPWDAPIQNKIQTRWS
jgi:hypothetical protein